MMLPYMSGDVVSSASDYISAICARKRLARPGNRVRYAFFSTPHSTPANRSVSPGCRRRITVFRRCSAHWSASTASDRRSFSRGWNGRGQPDWTIEVGRSTQRPIV